MVLHVFAPSVHLANKCTPAHPHFWQIALVRAMQASAWLYTAPVQPDSLVWSQDDLLAVAAGPAVVVLNPYDMKGPRSYINFSKRGNAAASHPQCTPEEPDSSLKYALSCMRTERLNEFSWAPHVKSIAWSPSGCGPDGVCLLATVLSDHQVFICSPFGDRTSAEWNLAVNLTDQFQDQTQHMMTKGKVYRKARSKYRGSNPGLRLKGGGITKEFAPPPEQTSLFVEGAEIEVPGQSPHLSCIWYKGILMRCENGFGFVEYTSRDDKGQLKRIGEWWRIPGISFVDGNIPIQKETSQASNAPTIRPPQQQNESLPGTNGSLNGQVVEVEESNCWVPALVHNAQMTNNCLGVELSGCPRIHTVSLSSVRLPETWSLQGWAPVDQAGIKFKSCIESDNMDSTTPIGSVQKIPVTQQAIKCKKNTRGRGRGRGVVGTRQNPRVIPGKELPDRNPVVASMASTENNVGSESDVEKSKGRRISKKKQPSKKKGASGTNKKVGDQGICTGGSKRVGKSRYTSGRKGKGRSARRGSRSNGGHTEGNDEEDSSDEDKVIKPREQWVTSNQPYVVPDDFNGAIFGCEPDGETSRKFLLDVAKRGLYRWLSLRSKISEDKLPEYSQSVRLQGEDLRLVDQVIAELSKVFGAKLEKREIPVKELVKELKKNIRRRGICSHNVYHRADRPHLTRHHSLLPIIGQKPANITGTKRSRDYDEAPESQLLPSADTCVLSNSTFPSQALTVATYGLSRCRNKALKISYADHASLLWSASVENFVPRRNKTRPKVPINPLMSGVSVPKAEYEARASLSAAKCVAWSPVAKEGAVTYAILAVGTESGHIVFWRIPCYSQTIDALHTAPLMLGSAAVHRREVSVLKWQKLHVSENQILAVLISGSVDGDIRLSGLDLYEVSKLPMNPNGILDSAYRPWGWICEPDMQPVTCLSVGIEQQWDGDRLVVAAGKSGGTIAIWRSPLLKTFLKSSDAASWLVHGKGVKIPKAHKTFCVTGIACCLVDGLVASTGMDCSVKCWRNVDGNYIEIESPKSIDGDNGSTCVPYGMAQSRNGLLLAVIKDQGLKQLESQTHKMSWEKVAHAKISMMKIMGGGTMFRKSLSEGRMATRVLLKMASVSDIAASFLFDASEGSFLGMESFDHRASKSASDEEETDEGFSNPVPRQVGTHETLHKVVLEMLEDDAEEFLEIDIEKELPNMWPKLRLAVALRRMLGHNSERKSDKKRIDLLELYLLQKHVHTTIANNCARSGGSISLVSSPIADDNRVTLALMMKWVLENENNFLMHSQLVELAVRVNYAGLEGFEDDPFSNQQLSFGTGSPVEAVQVAISSGTDLVLNRCSSTFLTGFEVPFEWSCPLCFRNYLISPQKLLGIDSPDSCLYCGTKLAPERGSGFSLVPGAFAGLRKQI